MTEQSTPAGWYPDGSGRNRWWDGTQWTEHFQAPEPPAAAPAPAPTPAPAATAATHAAPSLIATARPVQAYTPAAAPSATSSGQTLVSDHVSLAILAVATSVLVLVGSVGPWATAAGQSVNGTADGADGIITLILAIAAAATVAATVYLPVGVPRIVAQWATVVIGLAVTIIGIIDLEDVNSTGIISAGWGLWLVVLAGVALTVSGVLLAMKRGHQR